MTKEIRNQQTQIVVQSSLKLLLEWSKNCDKCLTLKELTGMTEVLVEYVQTGYSKDIGDRFDKIENYINSK